MAFDCGESKTSARTRLYSDHWCTSATIAASGTDGITHVLIDEVHERGVDTDFLMCVLLISEEREPSRSF